MTKFLYLYVLSKKMSDPCSPSKPTEMGLKGVDASNPGAYPNAALQFIELDSTTVVGVFRCNSCPDWKPDEYRHWILGRSAEEFLDILTKTILTGFEKASTYGGESDFKQVGAAL